MQVNLKQSEIIAALKMYLSDQGINLTGKQVEVAFTAGRKESGISADISIEESDVPRLPMDPEDAQAPALSLVTSGITEDEVTQEAPAAVPVAAVPAGQSLFN